MPYSKGSLTIPLVSVIIVNWNGLRFLETCLSSLFNQSCQAFEVIIVDNGSTDGSLEFIKANFPKTIISENRENLGFGEGNNVGIRLAEGRYIALLNNDTVTHPEWLQRLYKAAERSPETFGMWASKILFYDNPETIDTAGHLMYPDGLNIGRGRGERDQGQYDREEEVFFQYRRQIFAVQGISY